MRYSPESLEAFVQTVASGSFSAAARALGKSQSTISTAVARLEDDMGFLLFERSGRQPVLTEEGLRALARVNDILAASRRLDDLAIRMSRGIEPRLTLAISDIWPADHHEILLHRFAERYPDIEFECLVAEDDDVLELLQTGRAHLGVVREQPALSPELEARRLKVLVRMGVYIHHQHPVASESQLTTSVLKQIRQLRLNTWIRPPENKTSGQSWSASSYLLLMDMAEQGFGWSELPCWMVRQFGRGVLQELTLPGWQQQSRMDVIWSTRHPPGPAGYWMIDQLCQQSD